MIRAIFRVLRCGASACSSGFGSGTTSDDVEGVLLAPFAGFSERVFPGGLLLSLAPGPASANASSRAACDGSSSFNAMVSRYFTGREALNRDVIQRIGTLKPSITDGKEAVVKP